ncbi:DUF4817 domain-containing protein [Trichonephila clavipes]|nr:DUF4817 domain-containing protein [Trichonephila clavipes]
METLTSESTAGTSSAWETGRSLGLRPFWIRHILHGALNHYPYKLQSCHELLPSDTVEREAFARWALSIFKQDSCWVFNITWTDEAHFSFHGDVSHTVSTDNTHNCRIWRTSNSRVYTGKSLHSPKVTVCCGFIGSFIIGPLIFETQCPVNGWKTVTVNVQRYLTLLREKVAPCLEKMCFLLLRLCKMEQQVTLLIQSRNS